MKKMISILLAVIMLFTFSACGSKDDATTTTEEKAGMPNTASTDKKDTEKTDSINIGVSFGQNVHPFFVAMQKGIEAACEDYKIDNLNILAADSSLETQVSQIENLVTKGCDVILLNPYDSDGVANAVQAALDSGVGIFTMDIDCDGSTAFVASDNYVVGQMLAQHVIDKLGGEGKVAIIDGIVVTSLKDRTQGFMDTIKNSNIEVIAEQQTAHARETALASAENILQAHPDIDAFVGVNENSGMAILSAVTSAGLDDILITTVDATAENMMAIQSGKVEVGVSQDPYQMGYSAVEQAIKWHNGEEVQKFTEVPVEYMTRDNVQQFIEREKGYGVEVD